MKQGSGVGKHACSFMEGRFALHTSLCARQAQMFELSFSTLASKGKSITFQEGFFLFIEFSHT